MQFSDIYNDVADQFGDTSDAMITRIKRYINWNQQEVCTREEWDFVFDDDTFNCVASTDTYPLDTTAGKVIDVLNDTTKTKLVHIDRATLDSFDASRDSGGSPCYWTEAGRDASGAIQIQLYPVPDGTDTINYYFRKKADDLSADSDISIIPSEFHKVLYLGALAQCYDYDQDPSSTTYWTQFENMIEDMKKYYLSGSEDKRNVMGQAGLRTTGPSLRLPPNNFRN